MVCKRFNPVPEVYVSGIYAVERADVRRWESSLSFLFLSLFFFPSPSFSHFLCLFPPLVFPRRPPLAPALCARSPHHTGQGPRQGGLGALPWASGVQR